MNRHEPFADRNTGTFEDCADSHGELLAAGIAHVEAGAGGLALDLGAGVHDAAMRARTTIGPKLALKPFARLVGVDEFRAVKVGHGHSRLLMQEALHHGLVLSR